MAVVMPVKPADPALGQNPNDTTEELVAIINAINPTPWENLLAAFGAKIEEGTGKFQSVRTEANQRVARLAGAVKVKAGSGLTAGETLFTLPANYAPKRPQVIDCVHGAQVANKLLIAITGVVTLAVTVAEGLEVNLDGATYPTN